MKKLRIFLMALLATGTALTFTACNDKDDDDDIVTPITNPNETVVIKDDGNGTGTVTWSADKTYVLDGFVYVNEGQTLTIEPGTVIKGQPGTGEQASALIVARGAKIYAEGTPEKPIIFTAYADDVNDNSDLPPFIKGLWGGVIILGKAGLNSSPGQSAIEGIPTNEPRGLYGGSDDADNSGVFKYVSIRYGGSEIGAGNEINGLTMGGVGNGTTIEYVEVINNKDDGFEWFGGTVNAKHLVAAYCGDDSFDYDEGWRGNGQFFFAVQPTDAGERAGEHDGGTDPEDGTPYATAVISNATYIGNENTGTRAVTMRDNAGGSYHNSIFVNFEKGIDVEKLISGQDSYTRFTDGTLQLTNNLFYNIAGNDDSKLFDISGPGADAASKTAIQAYFTTANNKLEDPRIAQVSNEYGGGLNPVLQAGSPALSGAVMPAGSFFQQVPYKGAFGTNNWASSWSFIATGGYMN